ncbi:MAG: hypothetical protein IJ235_05725 [Eubacterium sp.]|nr:hypothetical protein [Eubacterium sp.]
MKYFKFSKMNKTEFACVTGIGLLGYVTTMALCYLLFGSSKYGIILGGIITAIIVIWQIVFVSKKRGVFLYDNGIEVTGGGNLSYVRYENIYEAQILTNPHNEEPLRQARTLYVKSLIVYTLIYLTKLDNIRHARYAGGARDRNAEYIKLTLDINDEDYYLYFSLEDNRGFVDALNKKLEDYPFVEEKTDR